MEIQKNLANWLRIGLGVYLVVYALNRFFHFLPTSYGTMPEEAQYFLDAVMFYLPYLYAFEILVGLLLIFNKWTPFLLIVLFPLSVSFLMFSVINNDFQEIWPAVIVAGLNIILLFNSRERYKVLFA